MYTFIKLKVKLNYLDRSMQNSGRLWKYLQNVALEAD